MKRQHEPIREVEGTRAERVLVLSHGAAEVTAGVMPTVLAILDANGVEVLATADEAVAAGAPKAMEWMLAFGLIVTLAWVYLEALKLAFRLAAMFGDRK